MSTTFDPELLSDSRQAALEILLLLADTDAGWGDYESAVDLLDCAQMAAGQLPDEYELKRARWSRLRAPACQRLSA